MIKTSDIKTYEQVLIAIEEFCDMYDDKPRYTFGHIVIDDLNLSDGHIEYCLRQESINTWFEHANGNDKPDSEDFHERLRYKDATKLRDSTIFFLRWLLDIPEEIRTND